MNEHLKCGQRSRGCSTEHCIKGHKTRVKSRIKRKLGRTSKFAERRLSRVKSTWHDVDAMGVKVRITESRDSDE